MPPVVSDELDFHFYQTEITVITQHKVATFLVRAIPFEKLVGGVSGVSFSDHPAATFHYFLGYPAVIFFPLTQCKKNGPSDHPAVISELFSDHPAAFF